MGDMADYYLDRLFDEPDDVEYEYDEHVVTCNKCEKGNLRWRHWDNDQFRLWDPKTESYHTCKAADIFKEFANEKSNR